MTGHVVVDGLVLIGVPGSRRTWIDAVGNGEMFAVDGDILDIQVAVATRSDSIVDESNVETADGVRVAKLEGVGLISGGIGRGVEFHDVADLLAVDHKLHLRADAVDDGAVAGDGDRRLCKFGNHVGAAGDGVIAGATSDHIVADVPRQRIVAAADIDQIGRWRA